ncbi:hypothetical protein [Ruegeria arenilitoris]|uniref:hypothetical protein n=1 Tax=Ruegeria arenilitoris TaxID=1173585 RepID=UPI00147FE950|nr:hypothetical protein [Ruegeria arenilitoris]
MDRALSRPLWPARFEAQATSGPEPQPRPAPVLIQDAVTPWGPDTLLLKLLRDQAADQEE